MDGQRNWREKTRMSSHYPSSAFYVNFDGFLLVLVSLLYWHFCLSLYGRMLAGTRMRDWKNMFMLFGSG